MRAEVINLSGKIADYTLTISVNGNTREVVPLHLSNQSQPYVANAALTLQ
jgi:hypothetical protein